MADPSDKTQKPTVYKLAAVKAGAHARAIHARSALRRLARSRYGMLGLAIALGIVSGVLVLAAISAANRDDEPAKTPRRALVQVTSVKVDRIQTVPARELMTGQLIDGKKGLLVSLTVSNETDSPQPFLPVHQMFLRDNLGHSFGMTPLGEVQHPIAAGTLKPGEKRSGEISFVVGDNDAELHLLFDSRWDGGAPVGLAL